MRCLNALANFYGVTTDYIFGRETDAEARIREAIKCLTPEQGKLLLWLAESAL